MTELFIQNEKYLSSKRTGYILGYTNDYIAKLCREGELVGHRVGKNWFIKESSIAQYQQRYEAEKQKRLKKLSEQRTIEYHQKLKEAGLVPTSSPKRKPVFFYGIATFMLAVAIFFGVQNFSSAQVHTIFSPESFETIPAIFFSESNKLFEKAAIAIPATAFFISEMGNNYLSAVSTAGDGLLEFNNFSKVAFLKAGEMYVSVIDQGTQKLIDAHEITLSSTVPVLEFYSDSILDLGTDYHTAFNSTKEIPETIGSSYLSFVETAGEKVYDGVATAQEFSTKGFSDVKEGTLSLQANVASAFFSKNINVASVFCNIAGFFGNPCEDTNSDTDLVQGTDSNEKNSQSEIQVLDDVAEGVLQPIIVYGDVPETYNYSGLTRADLEERLALFESQLDLTKETKVIYKDTFSKQTDSVIENNNDSVEDAISGGDSEFNGASLTVSGDINAGVVTAVSFVGDGSGLTGLSGGSQWSDAGSDIYYVDGNVGIGTTTTSAALTIAGELVLRQAGTDAIIIGDTSGNVRGQYAIDIQSGRDSTAQVVSGTKSGALGYGNEIELNNSYALGNYNVGTDGTAGEYNLALGNYNDISDGNYATAIGNYNFATSNMAYAIGHSNVSSANAAFSLGYYNEATYNSAFAIGYDNEATQNGALAIGVSNTASENWANAFGHYNQVSGNNASAFGNDNEAAGGYGTAIGYGNDAMGYSSLAFGKGNSSVEDYALAFGNSNNVSGYGAMAFGDTNTVGGYYATALGTGNNINGDYSTFAVGNYNNVFDTEIINGYMFGGYNIAAASNTSVFGTYITNDVADSLMIGVNDSAKITILQNGKVGIGTTTPEDELEVVGNIVARGILGSIGTASAAAQLYLVDDVNGYGGIDIHTYGGGALDSPHSYINLISSRGNQNAASNVLQGDDLGMLNFYAQADSGLELGAAVGAVASANFTGSNAPSDLYFLTNKSEKVRITSNGYVGIGTSTPSSNLTLGSGQVELPLGSAAAPSYAFSGYLNTGMYVNNGSLYFSTGGVSRGQFQSDGGFLVSGSNSGGSTITANRSSGSYGPGFALSEGGAASNYSMRLDADGSNQSKLQFVDNSDNINFTMLQGGNVGIGTTTPTNKLHVSSDVNTESGITIQNINAGSLAGGAFYVRNNTGVTGGVSVLSSTFVTPHFASRTSLLSTTGLNLISNSNVASGGSDDIRFYTGGYASGQEKMRILSNGNVGIGNTNPTSKLSVNETVSSLSANKDGSLYILQTFNPSADTGFTTTGAYFQVLKSNATNYTAGNGIRGFVADVLNTGDGNITDMTGFSAFIRNSGTGTITNGYAARIAAPTVSSTSPITNLYGLRIEAQKTTGVTNGYGLYQAGTNDLNYFAGNVGIGTTTPIGALDISGASTTSRFIISRPASGATTFNSISGPTGSVTAGSTLFSIVSNTSMGSGGSIFRVNPASLGNGIRVDEGGGVYVSPNLQIGLGGGAANISIGGSGNTNTFQSGNSGAQINTDFLFRAGGVDRTAGNLFQISNNTNPVLTVSAITGSGNIGIGTSTPFSTLAVVGTSTFSSNYFNVYRPSSVNAGVINFGVTGNAYIGKNASSGIFEMNGQDGVEFRTGAGTGALLGSGTVRMSILATNGNVGIGTTSPSSKLDVVGNIRASNPSSNIGLSAWYSGTSGRQYDLLSCYSCGSAGLGGFEVYDATAGATRAYIQADVNGWQTPSDMRLKENIETLTVLDKLDSIRGTAYTLKGSDISQIGVIAQEIKAVFPDAVSGEEAPGRFLGVSYNAIASIALQGVKEVWGKLQTVLVWFSEDGNTFNVQGDICVDDVCISKEEFKALLLEGASGNSSSNDSNSNEENGSNEDLEVVPEETTSDPTSGESDGGNESNSTPEPVIETSPEPEPTPEPEPVSDPEPEEAPEPEPAPATEPAI